MASRSQRYRLIHEFVLKDRGNYEDARARFEVAIKRVEETMTGIAGDYLAIEKVKEDPK